MAARFADGPRAGERAGAWRPLDDRVRVVRDDSSGIEYAQHTSAGTRPRTAETASWEIEWRAPESSGRVAVHAAANAANDDDSELGDRIYTAMFPACSAARGEAMIRGTVQRRRSP
jgi:hypothetical protein